MNYLAVFIGGFLGAITRGLINNIAVSDRWIFPIKTLAINLTGSFLLVFILTIAAKGVKINSRIILGITTGFLGAYTTFSTYTLEIIKLAEAGYYALAIIYLFVSNLGGLILGWFGYKMAFALRSSTNEPGILAGEKE